MLRRLLLLNGMAILGVILFHTAGWGFTAMFAWTHRYLPVTAPNFDQVGTLSYYLLRAIEQLMVFSIPSFLFVSGIFVAIATGRSRKSASWSTMGARIRDLIIPYLLWSILLITLSFVQSGALTPRTALVDLLTGGANPAYYYVPLLIQFYLLAPIITRFARKSWLPLLIVAGAMQLAVQLLYYPALLNLDAGIVQPLVDATPKWFFPARIFWFTLGIVAGFHMKAFEQFIRRIRWWVLGLMLVLFPLGILEWEIMQDLSGQPWLAHRETILDSVFAVAVIFSFLGFNKVSIPYSAQLNNLGSRSFGIYLIHSPIMQYTSRIVYHVAPWILASQLLLQPLLIVVGLGIPLLLMVVVSRSPVRAYYRYSFG